MTDANNNMPSKPVNFNRLGLLVTTVLLVMVFLSSTLFVVDQRRFGLVYQFGQVQRVMTEPGLFFKLPPPLQNVRYLDKRLLTLTSSDTAEPVLTAEKQRVVIDWYVRWRISNPLAYVQNVSVTGDETSGAMQLSRVVRNAFQEEVNRRTLHDLISSKREEVMDDVKQAVIQAVKSDKPWGIDIVDVRLTRVDYAESITASVYDRMRTERERVANELRSKGAAEAEQIRADADRQRDVIVANAYRDAQRVRGEGDAQANRVYAEAFGKNPGFAAFYRSLDAYRASIGKNGDVLVIDPASSDFFRNMLHPGADSGAQKPSVRGR